MSTRCRIGMRTITKTGKKIIKSIYCHYNGHPINTGDTLLHSYTQKSVIKELIEGGDIRSLEFCPDACEYYGGYNYHATEDDSELDDDFDMFECSKTEKDYLNLAVDSFAAYTYLYKNNKWYVAEMNTSEPKFVILKVD